MSVYGRTYRCAGCGEEGTFGGDLDEGYDRYGIYAGMYHDACWRKSGIGQWEFDPGYAGERLEEDDPW